MASGPTAKTLELVWERDQGCCVRCGVAIVGPRGWSWSLHHRRPRSSGGTSLAWVNLPGNLIILCGSATSPDGCHAYVESHRAFGRASGFLVSANGQRKPVEVPIHHSLHGVVILDDLGGWTNNDHPF